MPIVDGKYEAKISTTYATPQEGIDEIKRMIQKSRRLRISGIPMPLLDAEREVHLRAQSVGADCNNESQNLRGLDGARSKQWFS